MLQEAEQRILNLREFLQEKLQQYPASLEEQKKIIRYMLFCIVLQLSAHSSIIPIYLYSNFNNRNLVNLESPTDPAWLCIAGQYKHCSQMLFQCKDKYLTLEQEDLGIIF